MIDHTTLTASRFSSQSYPTSRRRGDRLDDFIRRILDVCGSIVGLILLSPLFLLVGIMIKYDSPGPIFYRGRRVGKGGRTFSILKFRTMYEARQSYQGPRITAAGDSRITPLGRWLRDTKLNELPQLWNVLRGDMSFVGPRPEDPEIVTKWSPEVKAEILSVRPGITSPASVLYRDEEQLLQSKNPMDDYMRRILPSKLRLDLLYIRNRSLLVDLDVLLWTMIALHPKGKRKRVPEHLLFWGPLSVFINRHLSWFLIDIIAALVAVVTAGLIWRGSGPLNLGLGVAAGVAAIIALLFSLTNALLGLDRIAWSQAKAADALDLIPPSAMVTISLLLIHHSISLPGLSIPSGMILVTGLLTFLGFVSVRYRTRILTGLATRWLRLRDGARATGERVLVVGAGEGGLFATGLLNSIQFTQAFSIVGMVDDDPRKRGMRISGCNLVGRTEDIPSLVQKHDIGLILFAISNIEPEDRQRVLSLCKATPARLILLPNIIEGLRAQFPPKPMAEADSRSAIYRPLLRSNDTINPRVTGEWLDELESLTQAKDWSGLLVKIRQIKTSLRDQNPMLH